MRRFFRFLVCLVLVFSILVNVSPIRAKAVGTMTVVAVGATLAVATAMIGLGIQSGNDPSNFSDVVTATKAATTVSNFLADNVLHAVKYIQPDGSISWLFPLAFLETLRDWFWDEDVLVPGATWHNTFSLVHGDTTYSLRCTAPFTLVCIRAEYISKYAEYVYAFEESGYTKTFYRDDKSVTRTSGTYHSYATVCGGLYTSPDYKYVSNSDVPVIDAGAFDSYDAYAAYVSSLQFTSGISTPYDLTLGEVGTADQTAEEAHPEWIAGAISVPGSVTGADTDEKYVPVGLPQTYDEALGKTQADVQSGVSTYDDTIADTETGSGTVSGTATLTDVIASIKAIPTSLAVSFAQVVAAVQAIPAAIADVFSFKPPTDHNSLALLDLKDFFPFCIPFDLYDFFTLLNASPVAPSFTWQLQDLSGNVYSVTIDLSGWNSVASIFRTMQLFLFITGLAAASRKFIKW